MLDLIFPIYEALIEIKQKDLAISIFNENAKFYHPMTSLRVKKLITNA